MSRLKGFKHSKENVEIMKKAIKYLKLYKEV